MGRVAISGSKIEASGKIGGRQTQGSINDKGAIELGIDFKVGGLGVTTDYGGGIKVSIAGQSITWGRTGGNIKLNVGGFEVIVEARNCIVTETKKIAGIKVAEHTYPDPGCKLPDPPDPPDPPKPPPGPDGIDLDSMTSTDIAYVLLGGSYFSSISTYPPGGWDTTPSRQGRKTITQKVILKSEDLPEIIQGPSYGGPRIKVLSNSKATLITSTWSYFPSPGGFVNSTADYEIETRNYWNEYRLFILDGTINVYGFTSLGNSFISNNRDGPDSSLDDNFEEVVAFGRIDLIKEWVKQQNSWSLWNIERPSQITKVKMIVYEIIPIGKRKIPRPRPFLPTGNKPPVNNDCCEEILDKLDDLEEILHVDFFKKNKFPVPAYLLAPGCDPAATTEIKNYYGLFRALFQALAHGLIVSPKAAIQDTDSVKEGDQSFNSEYLSATGWAEAITKMMYEVVDDGNVATNMDIRTGVTVTQLLVAVADLSHRIDTIIDVIGVTTIRRKDTVETSFSLVTQDNKKGFDPKKDNQKIDLNDDRSTEEVLAGLLQTRKNPIVKEEIHPKSKTLVEMLEALKNK